MDRPPVVRALPDRLVAGTRRRLRIDARALAAFRITLGVLLLIDLARRTRNLTAFYSDRGVLPRAAHAASAESVDLSLHLLSGEVWMQALLFALAGAFALALLVGYRTTLATVVSWVLLLSLHNRLPDVLNGGDVLLRLLLFFAIFLPLGARWSVDSHHGSGDRASVLSVAGAALLIQVVIVYVVNATLKLTGDAWVAGRGLEYVFSLGQFTILLGDVLGAYPALLQPLDYLWLATITLAPLLFVLTGVRRLAFVALLAGMHLGMVLTVRIDLFPLISIASLLPFVPSILWDELDSRLGGRRPVRALHEWLAALAGWLPRITVTGTPPSLARAKSVALTVLPGVFLVLVVLWNLQFLGYNELTGVDVAPDEAEWIVELTGTDQYWNMFAPDPLDTDGWIVAPGLLENGTRIDAFHGSSVRWDRPPDVSATYPTARWRKYLVGLWRYDTADREHFARYLCRRWNDDHETDLVNVSVVYVAQPTRLDAPTEPTHRVDLATRYC